MTRNRRDTIIGIVTLACLVLAWQALSIRFRYEIAPGVPMVPGWQVVFTSTLKSLSLYWPGGLGVQSVAEGAEPTYGRALLAILYHSGATFARLACGMVLGMVLGTVLALVASWSKWGQRIVNGPMLFIRALPLLAMIPLFQLWFGLSFLGGVVFVAYGVGVIFFTAVLNAVTNVDRVYIDNARTFGASKGHIYRSVILPSILPEFGSAVMLALGTGWAAVMGAEFLGAQSGLGYIIVYSQSFGYLDRMFLIACLIVVYVTVIFMAFRKLFDHLTRWKY